MATIGVCAYCEAPARTTCTMCGKAICRTHSTPGNPDVCVTCAQGASFGG